MSDINNSGWPFGTEVTGEAEDFSAIFGSGDVAGDVNPFEALAEQALESSEPPAQPQAAESASTDAAAQEEAETAVAPNQNKAAEPTAQPSEAAGAEKEEVVAPTAAVPETAEQPIQTAVSTDSVAPAAPAAEVPNPIEAAFAQITVENTKKGLLEMPPIFVHKNAREAIEDTSQTFEELRIRKSEDFADLEEGKYVSWSVEYCGIRKEIKDPKGTTIISVKETIERSREFLDALKKGKGGKKPECLVKPKVVMKTKGVASYKGNFQTVEEARASDKVICLIPSGDGRFYELRKTEQGEFIAPKNKVADFQQVRAGFIPALPLIPLSLIGSISAFFRSFMGENEEYEALALIYWDKLERRFFAYVPKQVVRKEHIEADLKGCPYDDDARYIRYADIHSHNSMEAFFSGEDDRDERGTGLYLVMGELNRFFPGIKARISCGGSFVDIDASEVIEGLDRKYPKEWTSNVTCQKRKVFPRAVQRPGTFLPSALEGCL